MTNIERLPDELWLDIFSYIPYLDLFRCFTGLNERINAILRSKRIKLQLKSNLNYEKSKILIEALPEYIIGLCIKYSNQDIDISPFKNLLSLHISNVTIKQLEQIELNSFKYLNQLNIVVCSIDFQLGNFLFSSNQLNYLTTCWFPNLDSYFQDNQTYQSCLTLRSLRLNYCHIQTFFKLLHFLPNLISFESALVPIPESNQLISFSPTEHLNLIRLKIVLRANVPFIDLQNMLLHVPCLEQFYLNINRPDISEEKFNLVFLASLLENRFPNMKKCDVRINLFSNNLIINLDDLKNISHLYNQVNIYATETYLVPSSAWFQKLLSKNLPNQSVILQTS
jgi:hypothetical protein